MNEVKNTENKYIFSKKKKKKKYRSMLEINLWQTIVLLSSVNPLSL